MTLSLLLFAASALANEFFVVSDFHFDIAYNGHYNASSNCSMYLAIGQQGQPVPTQAKDYAEYGRYGCDSPLALLESAVLAMQLVNSDPEFILLTGDIIGHRTSSLLDPSGEYDPQFSHSLVMNSTAAVIALFKEYFPDTQVVTTIGNNDGYEDYWTPSESEASDYLAELRTLFAKINPSISSSFTKLGYYTSVTRDGRLVISLNSNYFSIKRYNIATRPAEQQLLWLDNELSSTDRRVIVSMHIPPGSSMFGGGSFDSSEVVIKEFVEILQRHHDKIDFLMSGHYHSSSFQLIPMTNLAVLIHAAVSPVYGNNPTFRYYTAESSTFDYEDYVLNLMKPEDGWTREYTYSHIYRSPASDFKQLYQDLFASEALLLQYLVYSHGAKDNFGVDVDESYIWKISTGTTLQEHELGRRIALCSFRYVSNQEFEWCKNSLLPISSASLRDK